MPKVIIFITVILLTFHNKISAQWLTTGNSSITNMWLGTSDNGPLDIRTNSLSRMYIDQYGRIGVNNAVPAALLHINAKLNAGVRNFTVNYSTPGLTAFTNTEFSALAHLGAGVIGGNGFTAVYANAGTNSQTAAGYFNGKLIVFNGSFGIGTNSPIQSLDVNGRMNIAAGVIQRGGAAISGTSDLGLYSLENGYYMRFVTNNAPIKFYCDGGINPIGGNEVLTIESNGNVCIGTLNSAGYKLAVNGFLRAKKVVVETGWSDFVFLPDYVLMKLSEIEKYIKENNHLPGIPSAADIEYNGADIGSLLMLQMQKIEELTLYIIDQEKRIKQLENTICKFK